MTPHDQYLRAQVRLLARAYLLVALSKLSKAQAEEAVAIFADKTRGRVTSSVPIMDVMELARQAKRATTGRQVTDAARQLLQWIDRRNGEKPGRHARLLQDTTELLGVGVLQLVPEALRFIHAHHRATVSEAQYDAERVRNPLTQFALFAYIGTIRGRGLDKTAHRRMNSAGIDASGVLAYLASKAPKLKGATADALNETTPPPARTSKPIRKRTYRF